LDWSMKAGDGTRRDECRNKTRRQHRLYKSGVFIGAAMLTLFMSHSLKGLTVHRNRCDADSSSRRVRGCARNSLAASAGYHRRHRENRTDLAS
jgi:hypothetical protein